MKSRLLIPLMMCALLLASCYRQAEEPFQQVDSAEVVEVAQPTSLAEVDDPVQDANLEQSEGDDEPETPESGYITPEVLPGQIEQPTLALPTAVPILATSESLTVTPFLRPTNTPTFEQELDPAHECVYQVAAGDNLFRLSLSWNTTVQEIMDASKIESDALSIGQLLLIPGCDYAPTASSPTVAPEIAAPAAESEPESESERIEEDIAPATPEPTEIVATPTPTGPRIHIVSAGETLESISLRYRADVNAIIELNNLTSPDRLNVGQELLLPD